MAIPLHRSIVVLGAGTMGIGICEVAAAAGHPVLLADQNGAALERGLQLIRKSLDKQVDKKRIDTSSRDTIMQRIKLLSPDTDLSSVALVIEAIVERLDVKAAALIALETRLPMDAIIASNTSSLSITALGKMLARPTQVVGMHFFNPATILPLVEVVSGTATAREVEQTIVATARSWGKTPVVCQSSPGFIVNRVARPYYGEALRLIHERHADPATIDAIMRESGGFKLGPCELMDMIGHDVNFAVTQSVYDGFFGDDRYKPSIVQKALVDAGWLGRKSGRGFYRYDDAATELPQGFQQSQVPLEVRIEGNLGAAEGLARLLEHCANLKLISIPSGEGIIRVDGMALALTDGRTATARATDIGEPVVLFDLALDYATCTRVAIAAGAQVNQKHLALVAGLFMCLGKKVSLLQDAPGLAVMRTVAMLVNEAADAVQQGVATADDVDAAMRLGVHYPVGPIEWGHRIGLQHVVNVLKNLAAAYMEDRYRVSIWLQNNVGASQALGRQPAMAEP